MASCALTQDLLYGCDVGTGGIKEAYFIELENISTITESSGTVTAITKVGSKVFRRYQLVQETANFGEDITKNRQNGTLFYAQRGTIVFNKQSVNVRNEIMLLAKNNLVAVVKDNNGTWRMYGREYGLSLGGNAESGTAWGDRNGYNLNLAGNEPDMAPFVQESVIATLQSA